MAHPTPNPPGQAHGPAPGLAATLAATLGALVVLGTALAALLQPPPPARSALTEAPGCQLEPDGYLQGSLYGSVTLDIDWRGRGLDCSGMLRPDNGGIRLFFAQALDPDGHRLVVVVGIDAVPADLAGREEPANVTVIDERSGRFFSSGGAGRCWTRVESVRPVPGSAARRLRVEGTLYCAGALPSVNDLSSITLGDIRFAGALATDDD